MRLPLLSVTVISIFCGSLSAQDSLYKMKMKLTGHLQDVECVVYSPDGKMLVTGSWDRNINIYAADTPKIGALQRTLNGHMAAVSCLGFSKDGKMLASGSKDNTVRVWDPATGKILYTYSEAKEAITKVMFDPKSTLVMSSSLDGYIRINEFAPGAKPKAMKIGRPVNSFFPTLDRRNYFVATNTPDIAYVDARGVEVKKLSGHAGAVNALDLSADGKWLVSGSDDKTAIIWDITTGKQKFVLKGHKWKITSVQFSYDAKYVVTSSNDGETRVWDAETGKEITLLEVKGTDARSVAISPNLTQIAVATYMDATQFGAILYGTPLKKPETVKKTPPGQAKQGGATKGASMPGAGGKGGTPATPPKK